MGGGGLVEMFVTACSLVGVMRVISRMEYVAPPPASVVVAAAGAATEAAAAKTEEAKTKIKFDLPPSTTPVKAAGGEVSQVETPSWLDRDASALSTGEDGANDTTVQLDYLPKSPVAAVSAAPAAVAPPPTVDFPSLLLKPSTGAALRPQLVATPSWLVPGANQQQPSATLNNNNGRLGSPSWMSNKRSQAQTRALKSRATSE